MAAAVRVHVVARSAAAAHVCGSIESFLGRMRGARLVEARWATVLVSMARHDKQAIVLCLGREFGTAARCGTTQ